MGARQAVGCEKVTKFRVKFGDHLAVIKRQGAPIVISQLFVFVFDVVKARLSETRAPLMIEGPEFLGLKEFQ